MSYEPDPATAKLFARYKQAAEIIKNDKPHVLKAAEAAIRDHHASSPELAKLTGMSGQTFRTMAERLGVDIRTKPPTTGPEAEARRAGTPQPAPEPNERPSPTGFIPRLPAELGLEPQIRKLTPAQAKEMAAQAERDHPDWFRKSHRLFSQAAPTYLPYLLANDAWINEKVKLPTE